VSGNRRLRAHFGHVVGSAYARSEIDLERILIYMLPRPVRSDDRNDILLDGSDFESNYRALEGFLSERSVTQLSMWLVRGVEVVKPIKLDDRTVLRKLNPLEIADCLRGGLIVPRHEMLLPNDPLEGVPVGLFLSRKERKVFGNQQMVSDLDDFNARIAEKQEAVEKLQSSAALTDLPNLSVSSVRAESHSWDGRLSSFMPGGGASIRFSLVNRLQSDAITPSKAKLLRWSWSWLSQRRAASRLVFAARRLGYTNERVRLEDRLLDTMIAAESLYLREEAELSFRLAIRAAVWADPAKLGATRHEIYEFMKSAYDARSKIAHGGEPSPSKLKFKGNQIALQEFCRILSDIVRMGLVKAINYTERNSTTKFEPPWDKMILR
jgi:Apea-like HEPN